MQKGFTLIELMVVIAIVGILSAVAVPAYQNYIARSQISEALILSSRFKMEISSIYSDKATCPTLVELGVPTGTLNGKYVDSIEVTPKAGSLCNIQLTFKNSNINNNIAGKHLNLSMITYTNSNGSSEWSCTSNDIEQHLMPTSCKKI